jgi:hypothetical protein
MRCQIVKIADEEATVILDVQFDDGTLPRAIELAAEDAAWLAERLNAMGSVAAPKPQLLPGVDLPALIARLRAGDEAAVEEAYRRTFGSDMGRFVLAHHASEQGVGGLWEGPADLETSNYRHGRADAAIKLATLAGFDHASIAMMVLTERLEGSGHDGQFGLDDGAGDGEWD